jgi:RES domain-containing protein
VKITAWRIVQARHQARAFDGEGARLNPGRWNHPGIPLVYTAGSLALAALEILVQVEIVEVLRLYVCIPVAFDEAFCRKLDLPHLPKNWSDNPIPVSTRDLGSAWAKRLDSAVLGVPSAIIPLETNYLLNPLHPDFPKIEIGTASPFRFDARLLKHLRS